MLAFRPSKDFRVPRNLRLLATPRALDFERAKHELKLLLVSPWRYPEYQRNRGNRPGKWARNDPAFIILISGATLIISMLYAILAKGDGFLIWRTVKMIFIHKYLIAGFVTSSVGFAAVNKFLTLREPARLSPVEWSYFFDVHCNSFLFLLVDFYAPELLLRSIPMNNTIRQVLFNILVVVSRLHYCAISAMGYFYLWKKDTTMIYGWTGVFVLWLLFIYAFNDGKSISYRLIDSWL